GKARGSSSARPQRFASPRASYTNAVGRSHRTKRHSTIPAPEAAARAGAGADQRTVNAMNETLNLHGRPIGDRGSPRRLLRRFWRTASRYWSGKSCTKAWGLSGGLLLAIVLLVAAAYAINLWNRAIFDGLQSKRRVRRRPPVVCAAHLWRCDWPFGHLAVAELRLANAARRFTGRLLHHGAADRCGHGGRLRCRPHAHALARIRSRSRV